MQELIIIVKIPPEMRKTEKEHSNVTPQDVLEGVTYFGDTRILQTGALRKETAYVKSGSEEKELNAPNGVVFDKVIIDPVNLQSLEVTPEREDQVFNPGIGYEGFNEIKVNRIPSNMVDVSDTSASEGDVKAGKEFYRSDGTKVTGTYNITEVGVDRLQWKCNNLRSLREEFKGYRYDDLYDAINGLDTKYVEDMQSTFERCESLTRTPVMDMRSAINTTDMLKGCIDIVELNFKNVMTSIAVGDPLNMWGTKLTANSVVNLLNELCSTEKDNVLTVSKTTYNLLLDVYVKPLEKIVSFEEDPYFESKHICQICDVSDPEAQGIIEYAYTKKNWLITGGDN